VELASITLARRRPDAPAPLAKLWQLNLNQPSDDRSLLARLEFPVAPPQSLRVRIFKTTAERQAWHIQLSRGGISVVNRRFYVLRFRARASGARSIYASVGKAYGDYGNLGLYDEVFVTKNWELFQLTFDAKGTEPNARIAFDLGKTAQDVEISEVSLALTSAEVSDSQNDDAAVANSGSGNQWIVGAPDSDADVPTPQDPLVQKNLWPQLLLKPAWILVLLWCSGFLSKRASVEQEC
jgi:hypothetical protein